MTICLDANYLIGGVVAHSKESAALVQWVELGAELITAMPAWYEFICGPVTPPQISVMRAFLQDIVSFDEPQANVAAALFNATGRKRNLRVDCMIAGTAMISGAALATNNTKDFQLFAQHGLQLI